MDSITSSLSSAEASSAQSVAGARGLPCAVPGLHDNPVILRAHYAIVIVRAGGRPYSASHDSHRTDCAVHGLAAAPAAGGRLPAGRHDGVSGGCGNPAQCTAARRRARRRA